MSEKLKVIYKKLSDLKPYERNPRINDNAVQYVKKSIEEFGFKVPIICDTGGGNSSRTYTVQGGAGIRLGRGTDNRG